MNLQKTFTNIFSALLTTATKGIVGMNGKANGGDISVDLDLYAYHEFEMKRVNDLLLPWPGYGTPGSAGLDLSAGITEPVTIPPGGVQLIGTGIAIHIKDPNIGGFVYPRSGKGVKEGIVLANTVGVIDSDYQGEILIPVMNRNTDKSVTINPGDRIAQLVFHQITRPSFTIVSEFEGETARGAGALGSTGTQGFSKADFDAVYNGDPNNKTLLAAPAEFAGNAVAVSEPASPTIQPVAAAVAAITA